MEGLEISEIDYKHIDVDNDIFRLDSEFFNKESIAIDRQIKQINHIYLDNKRIVSGPFGSALKSESYLSEGVPFVRVENIKGGFYIDDSEIIYISEDNNNRLKNSQLFLDDLVLSKVGNTIGFFARVDERIGHCNISENNIGIKLYDFDTELKHYILSYLNCRLAQQLVLRRRSGNAQPKLNVGDLSYVPIPVFSSELTLLTSKCIVNSNANRHLSRIVYSKAEEILLEELGLKDWKPTSEAVAIKTFADFATSGRLDAEYYQPKYDELFAKLENYNCTRLGSIVTIRKAIEPGSDAYQDTGIPFMRVSNLSKFEITQPEIHLDRAIYEELAPKPTKDTILLSKDGSVGIAYKVEKDIDAITSGAILHLNLIDNEFLPDYLTLVLNSVVIKMQAERDAGGSVIQHWKPLEIENVIIPELPIEKQKLISNKTQESFKLRTESKRLLELAKTAVEMAIEQSEDVAIDYINANLEPAKYSFRHD